MIVSDPTADFRMHFVGIAEHDIEPLASAAGPYSDFVGS
jgi:hypothetical protein